MESTEEELYLNSKVPAFVRGFNGLEQEGLKVSLNKKPFKRKIEKKTSLNRSYVF